MAQVALAWMRRKPVITAPIIGATKMKHLDDAIASLELELGDDEVRSLEACRDVDGRRRPRRPDPPLVSTRVASLSRTFHSVRCTGSFEGVSRSSGNSARMPGGSLRSSAQPPAGHHPPIGSPSARADCSAARSTPVWPPETTRTTRGVSRLFTRFARCSTTC
jgi:hypothetical protein